ncbi:MAG: hypothetical protein K6T85_09540 [Gorillibacterium sp.]|nr:hypothetical protein [Gorillibacterium sp.]
MHFTKGPLREYERMMKEKPRNNREPVKTMQERDCRHCRYFDQSSGTCSKKKCVLLDKE